VLKAGKSQELIGYSLFRDAAEKMAPFSHGAVDREQLENMS
jgi:hypothetical protein